MCEIHRIWMLLLLLPQHAVHAFTKPSFLILFNKQKLLEVTLFLRWSLVSVRKKKKISMACFDLP